MFGRAIAVGAATVALVLGGATVAGADGNVCESGEFCLYENTNLNKGDWNTYGKHQWRGGDSTYSNNKWWDYKVPAHHNVDVLNDEASSLWNNSSCKVDIAQHADLRGDVSSYPAKYQDLTFSNNNVGDNRASSHGFRC